MNGKFRSPCYQGPAMQCDPEQVSFHLLSLSFLTQNTELRIVNVQVTVQINQDVWAGGRGGLEVGGVLPDQVLCVLYRLALLTPSLPCLPFSPGTRTLEPQGLKAASQRVRSDEKARPGEHWGLHHAHRGPIDVLPKLPRATAKTKPGPNYSSLCLHIQCPVQGRGWRCQAPRGAWEGIFWWLEARGLGTRRLEDKMVMVSKEKVLSWGVEP